MNINEVFSSGLYDCKEFYKYFSKDEILNIPFGLYKLIDIDQKTENDFIFSNIMVFLIDLYVTLNVNDKDFEYIDSKLKEIDFCEKFSVYLYSDFLFKKEGAILAFAKMQNKSNCKYLERAFIDEYYKKNPILTSRCLRELFYLKSEKADEYKKLLFENIDLMNVRKIWSNAFAFCHSLTSIDLKNVTEISDGSFYECTSLKSINNLSKNIVSFLSAESFSFTLSVK